MKEALDRLHQAIDCLKQKGKIHKQKDIVETLKMSQVNVSRALQGQPRYLTEGFLRRFADAYSDYISKDWLLTGEGEMEIPDKDLRPFFENRVSAGFMTAESFAEYGLNLKAVRDIFPDFDFFIRVQGDSMEPTIAPGDILLGRIVTDSQNPPFGEICIIDTSVAGPMVKILEGIRDDLLILKSINPRIPEYKIETQFVLNVARVIGSIRLFLG